MANCPNCNGNIAEGATSCPNCGAAIPASPSSTFQQTGGYQAPPAQQPAYQQAPQQPAQPQQPFPEYQQPAPPQGYPQQPVQPQQPFPGYQQPTQPQGYQQQPVQQQPFPGYQQPGMQGPMNTGQSDVEQNKIFALCSYLGILFLVPLLGAKDSPFARFHANQGIVLFIAEIACTVALSILATIFGFISSVLSMLIGLVLWVAGIAFFVFAIMGIVNAVQGQMKPLPLIGHIQILK